MTTERLTSLEAVKDWLGIESDGSDTNLTRIIDAASRFLLGLCGRESFGPATYTHVTRGHGKESLLLPQWPVMSISSLSVGGGTFGAANIGPAGVQGSGYTISEVRQGPQSVTLWGYGFAWGAKVSITYQAGFETIDRVSMPEEREVRTREHWAKNVQVIDADTSQELTQVTGDPAAVDQYSVDDWGVYHFHADRNDEVIIRYGYVPADVSFAATQLIGEWYKRKDRIGLVSKSLGGQESVSFSQANMTSSIRETLQPYMNVVPI